jgi:putative redox protein
MSLKSVRFPNDQGRTLVGRLHLPDGGGPPAAWGVFAHCFTCSKDYKAPVYTARALAAHGVAVLRFDFTGLGDSEGEFSETTFQTNVSDVVAAARWMAAEHGAPDVLVGHSMGGAAVLMAAARVPSVSVVATIAAPAAPGHVAETLAETRARALREGAAEAIIAGRPVLLRRRFFEALEEVDPGEALRATQAALLLFHSPGDQVVPISNAARLFQTARHPKSFVSLPGADHLLSDEADAQLVGEIVAAWVRRYRRAG